MPSGKDSDSAGRKVDSAFQELDRDAERLIAYLNDEIVPAIRQHSSRGLRAAAQELQKFAEFLDRQTKK
ncbi:MAG TPA: hypothetical protein VFU76_11010 [Terriglobales bacterium]|nr:hypothetical protein [Terriglobales bacterium]